MCKYAMNVRIDGYSVKKDGWSHRVIVTSTKPGHYFVEVHEDFKKMVKAIEKSGAVRVAERGIKSRNYYRWPVKMGKVEAVIRAVDAA